MNKTAYLAGYLRKEASNKAQLRVLENWFPKGEPMTPLWHFTHKNNVEGLLNTAYMRGPTTETGINRVVATVMTPTEAVAKRLATNVEGSGFSRFEPKAHNVVRPDAEGRVSLEKLINSAQKSAHNVYEPTGEYKSVDELLDRLPQAVPSLAHMSAKGLSGDDVGFLMPGVLGGSRPGGNLKNWNTVSFSSGVRPDSGYGPVGVLTNPGHVTGHLGMNPKEALTNQIMGIREVKARPAIVEGEGLPDALQLPRATGPVVYHPQEVTREMAKMLKERGAMPINTALKRKIKWLARQRGLRDAPLSKDVNSFSELSRTLSDQDDIKMQNAARDKLREWLSGWAKK